MDPYSIYPVCTLDAGKNVSKAIEGMVVAGLKGKAQYVVFFRFQGNYPCSSTPL